jgi:catechol 2,3-dioxygenase-like lactoylglutathione lyase family enzyme
MGTREIHVGRLIDHVHLRASDLAASKRFYRAVLGALERQISADDASHLQCDELWLDALAEDRRSVTHVHLAFQARDANAVRRFYEAGLAAGGRDNGAPGERPYHPGYFAAFLLDPDGNNVEAVYHGPGQRSADSVVIRA